ncbi:MAG: methionyl-tRNA formyltransferase [Candidatus Yanofskybacteria bacterium RIFCSPHIGHO2_01_FULL_44_22]|uniref:Methionyl-tRNA formyltransferase n=1 Tax=Candidatus Yanofskybacteria bacterium RIFCSPHIGHO2_01_FULL_44_22 TaxID=1802669 RepID=A0A1F8EYF8_9BACT|nr:MAG: methionyl-tRNA formyltransferase [Candidatus Yanofskybacteria bacterium RIFCSPHIGHO2_01_FULL_44_22]
METDKIKIIFFGTPEFSIPAFQFLIKNGYQIIAAVTAPDKPFGRRKISTPPPVKVLARQNSIPVFQPVSLKRDAEFLQKFKELKPDLCVIVAYGKIIPKDYLGLPQYGFVNIHPSLLPKYRGPSPIQSAILNGEKETGVTIMLADEEVDHGPILAKREFSIFNFQFSNRKELEKKLAELGAKLLIETLPGYLNSVVEPKPQNHSEATFTKMFSREDGKISWPQTAEQIYNQIRALNPEPGTWTTWNGRILNILNAEPPYKVRPCRVCRSNDLDYLLPGKIQIVNNQIAIQTSKCYLVIKSLQLEGGKEMDAKSFLRGHPDFASSRLK